MQDQNPEFQNLLRLLESTEPAQVQLGLQIAQNYQTEFEAHFGYTWQDYSELVEFLWRCDARDTWTFTNNISKIKELNLSRNSLEVLPKSIYLLSNLCRLDLSENKLKNLPSEIGKLQKLENLCVASNQLTQIPKTIGNLSNLKHLYLNNNQLTKLPETIANINDLILLEIADNNFTELPLLLKNITNCTIYVGKNPSNPLRKCVKDWEQVWFENFWIPF